MNIPGERQHLIMDRIHLQRPDIDLCEVNEAFACQALYCT